MIRALLGIVVLALLFAGGLVGWQLFEKERLLAEQRRIIADLELRLDRVWAEQLLADVKVLSTGTDPATGGPTMDLRFVQYAPGTEDPVLRRDFTLAGEEFYVDALVVRFERPFVEVGDGLRGKSLLLFRRAFGDRDRPVDGVPLYRTDDAALPVTIPELFQVDAVPTAFEEGLWSRFWTLAADPAQAREAGVRVAQGEAPYTRAVEGQVYKLTLRASGGLEITPRLPPAVLEAGGGAGAPRTASPPRPR
jgi:hypothetical protein